jgi:hypothetical protein
MLLVVGCNTKQQDLVSNLLLCLCCFRLHYTCLSCAQDLLLGMRLATAAGQPWLLQNGALAAWNAYVTLLQRQRYTELTGVMLPLLRQLLKVRQLHCILRPTAAAGCQCHMLTCIPPSRDFHQICMLKGCVLSNFMIALATVSWLV